MERKQVQPGEHYAFQLKDVICPDERDVQIQITSDLLVIGEALLLSDSGNDGGCFAVIQVAGIGSPVIVPVDRLTLTKELGSKVSIRNSRQDDIDPMREAVLGG